MNSFNVFAPIYSVNNGVTMLKHLLKYCFIIFPVLSIPGCASIGKNSIESSNTTLSVTYFGEIVHTRNPNYTSVEDFAQYIHPAGQKRIIFSADWCKTCSQLRNDLKKLQLEDNIVWVNVEELWVQEMVNGFEVKGVPTLLIVETPRNGDWVYYDKKFGRSMIILWLVNNNKQNND